MRNLLFEKRNCTITEDNDGNFVITLVDSPKPVKIENDVAEMLAAFGKKGRKKGKNNVIWWNIRGLHLRSKDQYATEKVSSS